MIILIKNNTLILPNIHSVFLFLLMFSFSSSNSYFLNEGANKGHISQVAHMFPKSLFIIILFLVSPLQFCCCYKN